MVEHDSHAIGDYFHPVGCDYGRPVVPARTRLERYPKVHCRQVGPCITRFFYPVLYWFDYRQLDRMRNDTDAGDLGAGDY